MGGIVASATFFGMLVALYALPAALSVFGPEDDQCDLKWICKKYCSKKKE